jgi:hypothetical protein
LELGRKYGRNYALAQRDSTRPPRLRESETGVNDAGQPREPLSANKFADRDDTGPRPKSSVISNWARRGANTMILSEFYPLYHGRPNNMARNAPRKIVKKVTRRVVRKATRRKSSVRPLDVPTSIDFDGLPETVTLSSKQLPFWPFVTRYWARRLR